MERKIMAALSLLLIIVVGVLVNTCNKNNLLERQVNAKNSENVQYRNKNNELISEKLAIVEDRAGLKSELEYMKKQGDTLRSKIKSSTQAIVYLKKKIEITGTGVPDTIRKTDSIYIGTTIIDTPSYTINKEDAFHKFEFAGNKQRYAYKVGFTDNTELAFDETKAGTLVKVVNRNPYVIESEAKTLLVPKKKNKLLVKILYGVAGIIIGKALL